MCFCKQYPLYVSSQCIIVVSVVVLIMWPVFPVPAPEVTTVSFRKCKIHDKVAHVTSN